MARTFPSHIRDAIRELADRGIDRPREVQRRLAERGIRAGHVGIARVLRSARLDRDAGEAERESPRKWSEDGDAAKLEYCTDHKVRTLDDAIKYAEVDLTTWRVKSWEATSWECEMKVREESTGPDGRKSVVEKPVKRHLWRVWMRLERVAPRADLDALPLIFARWKESAPRHRRFDATPDGAAVALVVGLMDAHFGKLAWAAECGEDYDLAIAESVFANAIDDLMAMTSHLEVERIILPIGNDLAHIDAPNNTTTAGTPVDTDGRQAKIIATIKRSVLRGVERLAERAPVDAFGVPGNHDRQATLWLMHIVDAYFHRTDRVAVDLAPTVRKYRQYGATLLGFVHGDKVRDSQVRSLMNLMTVEQREKISGTTYSEWFCGHQHRSRKFEQKSTDTYQGTVVRFLSALSGTDAWHQENGLTGSRQAAEVYAYHRATGYMGHFLAPARS